MSKGLHAVHKHREQKEREGESEGGRERERDLEVLGSKLNSIIGVKKDDEKII